MARNKLRPYLDALMALVSSLLIIGSATSLIMQRENGIIILREDELFLMGQGFFIFAVLIFIKMSDSAKYVYAFFVFGVNIFANVYILHKGINQLRLAILGVSWFGFVILMFLGWFHLLNTKHRMVLLLIPVTMVIGGSFGVILKGMEYDSRRVGTFLNDRENDIRVNQPTGIIVHRGNKIIIPLINEPNNPNFIEILIELQ